MALQVTTLSVYSAVKSNNRLFKLKTNRLKGRFVFEWVGFSDDLYGNYNPREQFTRLKGRLKTLNLYFTD